MRELLQIEEIQHHLLYLKSFVSNFGEPETIDPSQDSLIHRDRFLYPGLPVEISNENYNEIIVKSKKDVVVEYYDQEVLSFCTISDK